MSSAHDLVSLSLTQMAGVVWSVLMLLTVRNLVTLRRPSVQGRSHAAAQLTYVLEEQRSRMSHLLAVRGRDDLHIALAQAEADRNRVSFPRRRRATWHGLTSLPSTSRP